MAQPAPPQWPEACQAFLGTWHGTFSQGFYGPQLIEVRSVSPDCVASVVYNPVEGRPAPVHPIPIRSGAMEFSCSVPGGICRLEIAEGELHFTFREPRGFVNTGVFRRR